MGDAMGCSRYYVLNRLTLGSPGAAWWIAGERPQATHALRRKPWREEATPASLAGRGAGTTGKQKTWGSHQIWAIIYNIYIYIYTLIYIYIIIYIYIC